MTVTEEVGVLMGLEVVEEANNAVEVDGGAAVDEDVDVMVPQPGNIIANRIIRSAKILNNLFIILFLY